MAHKLANFQSEVDSGRKMYKSLSLLVDMERAKRKEAEQKVALFSEKERHIRENFEGNMRALSEKYLAFIKKLFDRYQTLKEYSRLEGMINERAMKEYEFERITTAEKVKDLSETLAVPRDHFLNVRKKKDEAYIEQKERLLTRISENSGVPRQKLI